MIFSIDKNGDTYLSDSETRLRVYSPRVTAALPAAAADATAIRQFANYLGPKSKYRHGSSMQTLVVDMCEKFYNDRFRNDRALVL